jgi:MYXO-CTERM domain-containing protein
MKRAPRHPLHWPLLAGLLLAAGPAAASSGYPAEIKAHLGLSYTPPCSLCHTNGVTGYGTVNTPFGKSMRARGLVCCNLTALDTALDALAAEKTDSDGDGIPDITELQNGTDPNTAGGGPVTQPTYGCFNVTGQGPTAGAAAAWLLALVAARLLRRRSS